MSDIHEFNSANPIITNSDDLEEGEILSQTSLIVDEQNMEIEKNDIIQQESKIEFSFVAQSQAPQQVLNLEEKVSLQKLTKDQDREERSRSRSKKEKSHKDKKSKHKHDKHDKHDKKKKKKEHKHKDRKRSPSIDKDGKTIKKHERESEKKARRSRSISKSRISRDSKDNRSRSRIKKDSRHRDNRDYDHRRSSRSNSRYEIYDRDQRRHYERRSDSREDRRHNRVDSKIQQSSKSSKDIKNQNHQSYTMMRDGTQNQRGDSQFASDTQKVQTPKTQAVATFGSLSRDKKDQKTFKQKFIQSLEESKSDQDLSEDEEMIDEEEQIRREMEERQKRLQQLAALKNQTSSQQQMIITAVQVQQNISPKVEAIQIQAETTIHANLDNKMIEIQAQVECVENQSTSLNENQVQEQICTDLAQTKPQVNIEGLNETQTQQSIDKKDLNEKDWYDHQNQNELSNDKSKDAAQPLKTKKKFNMFDESSEEEDDHVTQAIEKGFEVKAAQVDVEGYYLPKVGELIRGKYKVSGIAGKGVFSCVVKALDINPVKKEYELVAIKIIRLHDIMRQSGVKEKEIVQILNKSDPLDKKNTIRLLDTFEYNNHLCLVYEQMELNLRETMHKYGRNVGLSLDGVCLFGRQLFQALQHLHKHKLIHADLKPDNIMVDKDAKKIKLCDFGSCLGVEEAVITEYMVSRFYRAPEIMLGCEFDQAIDIWSAGVTLYELYTGKVMFYGRSNNEMLKLIMMSKGKIKTKMLKKAQYAERHFNMLNLNVFLSQEEDPLNKGQFYQKPMPMPHQPQKPILFKELSFNQML